MPPPLAKGPMACSSARLVDLLHMLLDLCQLEPCRFELLRGIESGLIEEVRRIRIGALSKHQQRAGRGLPAELHHRDVRIADRSITALPAGREAGAKGEDGSRERGCARNRYAGLFVAERLLRTAGVDALQTIDLAPRYAPGSECA